MADDDDFLDEFHMRQIVLDINKIAENLYQGAIPPKGEILSKKGFQVLVLCAEENQDTESYVDIQVICSPGDDTDDLDRFARDLVHWKISAARVANAVRKGKKVLVTCMAGLNRSGMVTALALHELTGWSGERIVKHIKSRRSYALCNDTFADYLKENLKAVDKKPQ